MPKFSINEQCLLARVARNAGLPAAAINTYTKQQQEALLVCLAAAKLDGLAMKVVTHLYGWTEECLKEDV